MLNQLQQRRLGRAVLIVWTYWFLTSLRVNPWVFDHLRAQTLQYVTSSLGLSRRFGQNCQKARSELGSRRLFCYRSMVFLLWHWHKLGSNFIRVHKFWDCPWKDLQDFQIQKELASNRRHLFYQRQNQHNQAKFGRKIWIPAIRYLHFPQEPSQQALC